MGARSTPSARRPRVCLRICLISLLLFPAVHAARIHAADPEALSASGAYRLRKHWRVPQFLRPARRTVRHSLQLREAGDRQAEDDAPETADAAQDQQGEAEAGDVASSEGDNSGAPDDGAPASEADTPDGDAESPTAGTEGEAASSGMEGDATGGEAGSESSTEETDSTNDAASDGTVGGESAEEAKEDDVTEKAGGESSSAEQQEDEKIPDENITAGTEGDGEPASDETVTAQNAPQEEGESGAPAVEGTAPGNETGAYLAFKLMQLVESDSEDAFQLVPIFEGGALTGPFALSPVTSDISTVSDPDSIHPYFEHSYADRFAFQFNYTPDSKDYAISAPTIVTTADSGIEPVVQDWHNDASTGVGSFTVLYRCKQGATRESLISLHLQITENHSVDTIWKKECGSGPNPFVSFGFVAHDHTTLLFNQDGTYGTDEQRTLEVGPLETSTELVMQLVTPAHTLYFADPYVVSNSEDVRVSLRGTIAGATLTSDSSMSFAVLYECKAATTAQIHFSAAIQPWDNVTATWRKDCGGSHSQALLIGTNGAGSFDVMQDGELSSRYNVTEDSDLEYVSGSIVEVAGDVNSMRFYVTNSDDTSDIQIQTISMTMSNPDVVSTSVTAPMVGGSYIPAGGAIIKRKESKSLYLHFMCKKAGKSLVLVTLPTLRYKNVEFGFIKECHAPQVYHHSGFLQTASSILGTIFVLAILGGIGTWVYLRRRASGGKYTAVPTNESVMP